MIMFKAEPFKVTFMATIPNFNQQQPAGGAAIDPTNADQVARHNTMPDRLRPCVYIPQTLGKIYFNRKYFMAFLTF
jgi:hypothetical protein